MMCGDSLMFRCTSFLAAMLLLLLTGCATGPNANPKDPLEPFNRGVSSFNDSLDRAVLKPVATVYAAVTPSPLRTGVTNFFSNLQDAWATVNSVLQLRPLKALESLTRFGVNTFFGFGGVLDVASEMSIQKHNEDLGRTLGRWGVPSGPYIMLPILGPSTLRDSATALVEIQYDPVSQITSAAARSATTVVRVVNTRANFLRLGNLLDGVALDKYSFTRDAYLAKRDSDVARSAERDWDTEPPQTPSEEPSTLPDGAIDEDAEPAPEEKLVP